MEQINIFECLYEDFKLHKPRVIELFAGYGSTTLGLKYLGVEYEHWLICEWALPSIIAYASVHRNELKDYGKDFIKELDKDTIVGMLFNYGVSLDYNKPATLDQLKRVKEEKLRLCLNSIIWSKNLVDISRIKGRDLLVEREREYLLTYSFPCQDLSLAGKRAGMKKGEETRSGLLWEVERILDECKELGALPTCLLMENVVQVHQAGNENHFKEWQLKLEKLGYKNYWSDLIATDYGIPQTRNRCFMVSILGDYNYSFPKRVKLKLTLDRLCEKNVDEKYYLKDEDLERISKWNSQQNPLDDVIDVERERERTIGTITTRVAESQDGGMSASMKLIATPKETIQIKNNNSKGYLNASVGDGVDIGSRMETHRGTVQKKKSQTITCIGGGERGVVIDNGERLHKKVK